MLKHLAAVALAPRVPTWATAQMPDRDLAADAKVVAYALSKLRRWLYERAMPKIDPKTGLYRADGRWNYRDTAADCYPFFCWAAYVIAPDVLNNEALRILEAEQRLCNHLDRIPARYDWSTGGPDQAITWEELVFGASEYVKDGLIAIVEITGKGPWYHRMQAIEDDIWKHAPVPTRYGPIPSRNVEVNGEQIQALARLFSMTGQERYLHWALRLAHFYVDDPDYVPRRLRDHGCEIIGGLGLLLGVLRDADHREFPWLADRLRTMFDRILAEGCNPDGLMFNTLGDAQSGLSDNWGYNYIAFHCYDMATGESRYEKAIQHVLRRIWQEKYFDYPWEGSIDGYADSIEGAIYLLNRFPVLEALRWVDRETKRHLIWYDVPGGKEKLWGTMKLESNAVRTAIMYTLMLTAGVLARPWQQGLELAARVDGTKLTVYLRSPGPWRGRLVFDRPRHRDYFGFRHDWPRLNTLPEWFTVARTRSYRVRIIAARSEERLLSGKALAEGLKLDHPGGPATIELTAV